MPITKDGHVLPNPQPYFPSPIVYRKKFQDPKISRISDKPSVREFYKVRKSVSVKGAEPTSAVYAL